MKKKMKRKPSKKQTQIKTHLFFDLENIINTLYTIKKDDRLTALTIVITHYFLNRPCKELQKSIGELGALIELMNLVRLDLIQKNNKKEKTK